MGMDVEKKDSDIIDLINTAAHRMERVKRDGVMQSELVLDTESLYFSTRSVNSDTFGRFVYELKNLESLAYEAKNHMNPERATMLSEQIFRLVDAYKKSIDGESSVSRRDSKNSQLTLIDKLSKNKQERIYTVHGDAKRSFLDGILNKQAEDEREE